MINDIDNKGDNEAYNVYIGQVRFQFLLFFLFLTYVLYVLNNLGLNIDRPFFTSPIFYLS
jgi:hypothetical protein